MLVDVDPLAGAGEGHHLLLLLGAGAEAGAGLRLGPVWPGSMLPGGQVI